jgi:hydrogenase nickel incorporation protein HypA/HybF
MVPLSRGITGHMHELSITQSILEIALRHGEQAQATKITDLHLVIGQLSSVVDDSVQFYWDLIAKDTLAEGATLHFKRIPARLECQDCGQAYTLEGQQLDGCPACESIKVKVVAGQEFQLESIEIEN